MKTTNDLVAIEEYITYVGKYLKITKGEEGLKMLLSEDTLKEAMIEYNKAYENFFEKFINSPKTVKEIIMRKMCGNVYFKINEQANNHVIFNMINYNLD